MVIFIAAITIYCRFMFGFCLLHKGMFAKSSLKSGRTHLVFGSLGAGYTAVSRARVNCERSPKGPVPVRRRQRVPTENPLCSTPGRCLQSPWCLRMWKWENGKQAGRHRKNIHVFTATVENKNHIKVPFAHFKGCASSPKWLMLIM